MEKNKILMIVIIALLVILLGAMVFIGIQVLAMATATGSDEHLQEFGVVPALNADQMVLVDMSAPISTNLRVGESGRSHLISTRFSIGIDSTQGRDSESIVELVRASDSITRSIALHAVRSRTFEELSHPDAMTILEQDILENLRREFNTNLIHRVFVAGDWYLES